MEFSNPKRMISSIKSHDCGNKTIVRVANPMRLEFGARCLGCEKKWMTRMSILKSPEGVSLLAYLHDPFATR